MVVRSRKNQPTAGPDDQTRIAEVRAVITGESQQEPIARQTLAQLLGEGKTQLASEALGLAIGDPEKLPKALALTLTAAEAATKIWGAKGSFEDIFAGVVAGALQAQREPLKQLTGVKVAVDAMELRGVAVDKDALKNLIERTWQGGAQAAAKRPRRSEDAPVDLALSEVKAVDALALSGRTTSPDADRLPDFEFEFSEFEAERLRKADIGDNSVKALSTRFEAGDGGLTTSARLTEYFTRASQAGVLSYYIKLLKATCHGLEEAGVVQNALSLFNSVLTTVPPDDLKPAVVNTVNDLAKEDYFIAKASSSLALPDDIRDSAAYAVQRGDASELFTFNQNNLSHVLVALGEAASQKVEKSGGGLSFELYNLVSTGVRDTTIAPKLLTALKDVSGLGCVYTEVADQVLLERAGMSTSRLRSQVGKEISIELLQRVTEEGLLSSFVRQVTNAVGVTAVGAAMDANVEQLHTMLKPAFTEEAYDQVGRNIEAELESQRGTNHYAGKLLETIEAARLEAFESKRKPILQRMLKIWPKDTSVFRSFPARLTLAYARDVIPTDSVLIPQVACFIVTGDPLASEDLLRKEFRRLSQDYHPDKPRNKGWTLSERLTGIISRANDVASGNNPDEIKTILSDMQKLKVEGHSPAALSPPEPTLRERLTEKFAAIKAGDAGPVLDRDLREKLSSLEVISTTKDVKALTDAIVALADGIQGSGESSSAWKRIMQETILDFADKMEGNT